MSSFFFFLFSVLLSRPRSTRPNFPLYSLLVFVYLVEVRLNDASQSVAQLFMEAAKWASLHFVSRPVRTAGYTLWPWFCGNHRNLNQHNHHQRVCQTTLSLKWTRSSRIGSCSAAVMLRNEERFCSHELFLSCFISTLQKWDSVPQISQHGCLQYTKLLLILYFVSKINPLERREALWLLLKDPVCRDW